MEEIEEIIDVYIDMSKYDYEDWNPNFKLYNRVMKYIETDRYSYDDVFEITSITENTIFIMDKKMISVLVEEGYFDYLKQDKYNINLIYVKKKEKDFSSESKYPAFIDKIDKFEYMYNIYIN